MDEDIVHKVMSAMGRKGGKVGGKRRVETTTPEQRRKWAKKASQAAHSTMTPAERQARASKAGLASAKARAKRKVAKEL